jgi:hypothetical protein
MILSFIFLRKNEGWYFQTFFDTLKIIFELKVQKLTTEGQYKKS